MEESAVAAASSILSIWASINSWFTPTILFLLLNLMIATILFTSNLPNSQNEPNQPKLLRSPSILHRLKSINLSPIRSDHNTHFQRQALEIAATEYVFNQPLDSNPTRSDPDPTRFDQEVAAAAQYADFSYTHEVQVPNAETHFVFEHQQSVDAVETRFESDPTGGDDTGLEENDEVQSLDEVYSRLKGAKVNRTTSDTKPASGELPAKLPEKMKKSASMKSAFSHFEEMKIVEARRPATVREKKSAAKSTEEEDVEVDARADDFINKFKHQLKLQRIDSIIRYKDMITRGSEK